MRHSGSRHHAELHPALLFERTHHFSITDPDNLPCPDSDRNDRAASVWFATASLGSSERTDGELGGHTGLSLRQFAAACRITELIEDALAPT